MDLFKMSSLLRRIYLLFLASAVYQHDVVTQEFAGACISGNLISCWLPCLPCRHRPQAVCRQVKGTCGCQHKWFENGDEVPCFPKELNQTKVIRARPSLRIESLTEGTPCPPGIEELRCLINPCDVTSCPASLNATCRLERFIYLGLHESIKMQYNQSIANYCGGCTAEFYLNDQRITCDIDSLSDQLSTGTDQRKRTISFGHSRQENGGETLATRSRMQTAVIETWTTVPDVSRFPEQSLERTSTTRLTSIGNVPSLQWQTTQAEAVLITVAVQNTSVIPTTLNTSVTATTQNISVIAMTLNTSVIATTLNTSVTATTLNTSITATTLNTSVTATTQNILVEVNKTPSDQQTLPPSPSTLCGPFTRRVQCLEEPCQNQTCDVIGATCRASSCGSCHAEWHLDGRLVQCQELCPSRMVRVRCPVNPCQFQTCDEFPTAVCRVSSCGSCRAEWFLNGQRITDQCFANRSMDDCPQAQQLSCKCTRCPSHPAASCRIRGCGNSCRLEFVFKPFREGMEQVIKCRGIFFQHFIGRNLDTTSLGSIAARL